MTWKQLPNLALGNECGRVSRGYSNCWRLQRLLEGTATVGSCGNCWKLRRLLEAATGCRRGPQHDGKCSFYFNSYFFRTTPTHRDLRQKAVYFPPRNTRTLHTRVAEHAGRSFRTGSILLFCLFLLILWLGLTLSRVGSQSL